MNGNPGKFDLAVIGGGILGTFHAYHALQQGLKVVLLEKNIRPQGATVRNFGQVVPSGMNQKWQRIGRRSLELYKEIHAQADITLRNNGSVYLASNEEEMTLLEELSAINHSNNYTSQMLSAGECLSRYEGLKASYCKGGLFFPEEITLESREAIHRVLAWMQEKFAGSFRYIPNTLVTGVDSNDHQCTVSTTNGLKLEAAQTIICSGGEFKALFPDIYLNSELVAVKIQMLQLVPQKKLRFPGSILTGHTIRRYESFTECPSFNEIKAREPHSKIKEYSIHVLFKQALDGSVILGDSHEYAPAAQADNLGFDLNEDVNQTMLTEAKRIFDLEDWTLLQSWPGLYVQCEESDIYLNSLNERIHIVTGIGGKGMTGGPAFSEQNIFEKFNIGNTIQVA